MCKKTKSITSLTTPGKERIHKSGKKWNKHDKAIQCCFTAFIFSEEFNSNTVLHFPKYFSKSLLERNDIRSVNIDAQHCQVRHFCFVFSLGLPFTESINF